jgi:hypothetical protein
MASTQWSATSSRSARSRSIRVKRFWRRNHRPLARTEGRVGNDCGVRRFAVSGLQGGAARNREPGRRRTQCAFRLPEFSRLEMHNWAAKGAAYADCVGQLPTTPFGSSLPKTYETQSDITAENADEKLTAIADGAGVKARTSPPAQPLPKPRLMWMRRSLWENR